jgi:hypothetical protein
VCTVCSGQIPDPCDQQNIDDPEVVSVTLAVALRAQLQTAASIHAAMWTKT